MSLHYVEGNLSSPESDGPFSAADTEYWGMPGSSSFKKSVVTPTNDKRLLKTTPVACIYVQKYILV